jgi:hypothetical protein
MAPVMPLIPIIGQVLKFGKGIEKWITIFENNGKDFLPLKYYVQI